MEYTVSKLARLSGVSARTLRYYDEIGLLKPKRVSSKGYRIYGQTEVDLLQQILFYRELKLSLAEIKEITLAEDFDVDQALSDHLVQLKQEKKRLDGLIQTVEKSIEANKGETEMTDQEKFEAFKQEKIDENEKKYGAEIREKYGEEVVKRSNKAFADQTSDEYKAMEALTERLNEKLAEATKAGEPTSELGQEVAKLHQDWIIAAWPAGYYDEEKHYNLSLMYVQDERFKAYYEKIAPGAATYLNEALKIFLKVDEK